MGENDGTNRGQWRRSNVFIVNFESISRLILLILLLTLSRSMSAGSILFKKSSAQIS